MKTKILFATLLTLALFTAGYAQTLDKAKLDQFFDRLAEKNKAMGSLTIAKDGNVLYTRAIGYSQINGTEKKPLTAASRFRIASITKTFTAVMILQLVEEGKLKLTDTLDKFFPQVPNAQKITILQILSHRSGIPNVRRDQATWKPGAPVTKDEMLALIVKGAPEFEPDTKNSYSNSGYFLLGLILEKLTGKPYDQALEERINSKIGLKDTYIATGRIDVNKDEALTYINTGSDWKQGFETHPSIGFQHYFNPRRHGQIHSGAVRPEIDFSGEPQSDENDEGRRGARNGDLHVRRQDLLREHRRRRQLRSRGWLTSRKKS